VVAADGILAAILLVLDSLSENEITIGSFRMLLEVFLEEKTNIKVGVGGILNIADQGGVIWNVVLAEKFHVNDIESWSKEGEVLL
jgi:hypothetical protein